MRHPFVARLRVSFKTETRLYLASDFYCGGCLTEFRKDHEVSKKRNAFTWEVATWRWPTSTRRASSTATSSRRERAISASRSVQRLHAVDATRFHRARSWMVSSEFEAIRTEPRCSAQVLVDRAGHVALCDFGIAAAC